MSEQKTLLLKVFQLKFESSGIYFKFGNIRFQEEQPDKIQLNMGSCVVTKINIKYCKYKGRYVYLVPTTYI